MTTPANVQHHGPQDGPLDHTDRAILRALRDAGAHGEHRWGQAKTARELADAVYPHDPAGGRSLSGRLRRLRTRSSALVLADRSQHPGRYVLTANGLVALAAADA
jgi:hypothetical protein